MYIAHRTEDGRIQTVLEHCRNVAALSADFASSFGAEKLGQLAGLLHDIGKYSDAFQRRIRGADIRVDHATAGAWECFRQRQLAAAFCVAGHHGGLPELGTRDDLPDLPTLCGRMSRAKEGRLDYYDAWQKEIVPLKVPPQPPMSPIDDFFFVRMLYSCIVDADYLDTEQFMQGKAERGSETSIAALDERLQRYLREHFFPPKGELNRLRCTILERCIAQGEAQNKTGLYTLTVPTGGGKTAASLAFALRHAKTCGLKRVIYVIPYTSIIEQTAAEFRKMLGEDVVLEHHSGVTYDTDENGEVRPEDRKFMLAAENWDMSVVVTTAVQFFESLYAAKPSKCRKLHNLANSVIIFDEAQMLPLPYLRPCVSAIAQLIKRYGTSAVLCTATQPALQSVFREFLPDQTAVELCLAEFISSPVFRRVTFQKVGRLNWDALIDALNRQEQVLCVVNSRKSARTVYNGLEANGRFHLSTLMYPAHRRAVLREIRERLKTGLPCRVVSTSLIEAGVDVDFPAVFREEAGLDSILQAAGRCNREGRRSARESVVHIFRAESMPPPLFGRAIGAAQSVMERYDDLLDEKAVKSYFEELLDISGKAAQDKKNIIGQISQGGFPFRKVADEFRLIEEDTRTVYIPLGEGAGLIERLRQGNISKELYRKLGQYSVSVYERQFRMLYQANALELIEDGESAILTDTDRYDPDTGLSFEDDSEMLLIM